MWSELSFVKGKPATVAALKEWRARRYAQVGLWFVVSLVIGAVLIVLTYIVARPTKPDVGNPAELPLDADFATVNHMLYVIRANVTVLALHACACFAGFLVYLAATDESTSAPLMVRRLTRPLGVIAAVLVPMATVFSMYVQAQVLGERVSTYAFHLGMKKIDFVVGMLPHATIELAAVFLPLAAWIVLSFKRKREQLMAATLVSCLMAVPLIVVAAYVETYQSPKLLSSQQHLERQNVGVLKVADNQYYHLQTRDNVSDVAYDDFDPAIASAKKWSKASGRSAALMLVESRVYVLHLFAKSSATEGKPKAGTEAQPLKIKSRQGYSLVDQQAAIRKKVLGFVIDGTMHEVSDLQPTESKTGA